MALSIRDGDLVVPQVEPQSVNLSCTSNIGRSKSRTTGCSGKDLRFRQRFRLR